MFEFNPEVLRRVLLAVPAILIAASFHEFAHGWAADRLGDGTARGMGRLTLNPIKHIDPVGSILVPLVLALLPGGFLFGWAKPVPVNPFNLRNPKTDMGWVAAAGPLTNFILALSAALLLRIIGVTFSATHYSETANFIFGPIFAFLSFFILINIILGIFNLIPIPPLDGGRIAVGLLPTHMAERLAAIEPYGMLVIVVLFIWDPLGLWGHVLGPFISGLLTLMLKIAGMG